jgi:3-oxoacyl-(acyl-carrier-protein) synthase
MRRVVVTGLGMVSPLACGVDATWQRLLAGQSGARRIDRFEVSDLPAQIACQIPLGDGSDGTYNPDQWMEPKEQRKVDDFIVYAMCAARQAIEDSGWKPASHDEQITTGVMIGSGIGGIEGIAETAITLKERGPRRVSPFFIPGRLINLASGYVSIEFGLKGPNHSVVTACSTGAHAIGDAGRLIALGDADVMVAGGTESPVNRLSMAGFAACRALSTSYNDTPTRASRPYDKDRDGFVMGEGAGIVVLEEYEHAKARGAKIYAELVGYGLSGDAFHITAPSSRPTTSTTSTRMAPRPWRTPSSSARWSGLSATRRARFRCHRPSPVSGTCSGPPAPSRRSSRFWRSGIGSRPRRSTSTSPRSRPRSTSFHTRRGHEISMWPCPIRSASAARTRPWSSAALPHEGGFTLSPYLDLTCARQPASGHDLRRRPFDRRAAFRGAEARRATQPASGIGA